MGLWSLLGGAASGWGEEGKYLDEKARNARQEALSLRRQIAEEARAAASADTENKKLEHQMKMEQLLKQYQHEETMARIDEAKAERQYEQDKLKQDLKLAQDKEKFERQMRQDFPEQFGGRRAVDKKWLEGLSEWERLVFESTRDLRDKPLQPHETIESRQQQEESIINSLRRDFSRIAPKMPNPESIGEEVMSGVTTKQEALNKLDNYRLMNPGIPKEVIERVATAIDINPNLKGGRGGLESGRNMLRVGDLPGISSIPGAREATETGGRGLDILGRTMFRTGVRQAGGGLQRGVRTLSDILGLGGSEIEPMDTAPVGGLGPTPMGTASTSRPSIDPLRAQAYSDTLGRNQGPQRGMIPQGTPEELDSLFTPEEIQTLFRDYPELQIPSPMGALKRRNSRR